MNNEFTCFFYGTLIFPQILNRVLENGRSNTEKPINIKESVSAVLKGYKRHKVIGAVYPAILKGDDLKDEITGVLLGGLSSQDIARLDNFEGSQYEKKKVQVYVDNNLIEAMTYVWKDSPTLLHDEDWNPKDFEKQLYKWNTTEEVLNL
ncbi:15442_t:CDS:2 [Funneliformis caledonium]|uniref:Putative gamma-glutamylcyclotransferase n=2 Tax=Funneliformis TaxID=1117308 RepID=A0A9N9ASP2_9GLOM|nr:9647_t:CDS:2 [Funneliformis mosseae]CAG8538721.1 15442_t:CDS:2 [Funneliformis caledonium]